MRPISNKMLGMTATLYTVEGIDEDRNKTWSGAVTLNNVFFTATDGQKKGSNGMEAADAAVLFYDMTNSTGKGTAEFKKGQRITCDGENFTVNTIKKYYSAGQLHHYELGLV